MYEKIMQDCIKQVMDNGVYYRIILYHDKKTQKNQPDEPNNAEMHDILKKIHANSCERTRGNEITAWKTMR